MTTAEERQQLYAYQELAIDVMRSAAKVVAKGKFDTEEYHLALRFLRDEMSPWHRVLGLTGEDAERMVVLPLLQEDGKTVTDRPKYTHGGGRVTKEQLEVAVRLTNSSSQAAALIGCERNTVNEALRRFGLKARWRDEK